MTARTAGGDMALDWRALESAIAGHAILPSAPEYDSLRSPPAARFDDGFLLAAEAVRPRAVVMCTDPADVSATIAFARRFGLQTAARSGGHCFAGHSSTSGVVIDVSPMRSVSVSGGVASVGAGTRLGDLYDSLEAEQLTIPAGCGPSVGIGGLTLGGGVRILGRMYGLTCDQLLAAEVVLADGCVIECDERHDEELFWALRGAGRGNFGVVTSFSFRTVQAPAATSFHLVWPYSEATAVLEAWQHWAPDAPEELAASVLITLFGDLDEPPLVNVFGAMVGTEAETFALLEELVARIGADPTSTASRSGSYRETKRYLAGLGDQFEQIERDRPRPVHAFSKSEFFQRPLPAEAIAALVAHFAGARVAGESRELDWMPWGGRTTACPPMPRLSPIATRASCSSTASCSIPMRRAAGRTSRDTGWRSRGRRCIHGDRVVCTRTSPRRTSPVLRPPTTAGTTIGCSPSSGDTTRMTSSASGNRSAFALPVVERRLAAQD